MKYAHVQATGISTEPISPNRATSVYLDPPHPGPSRSTQAMVRHETHLKLKHCGDHDHRDVGRMMSNSDCPDTIVYPSSPSSQ